MERRKALIVFGGFAGHEPEICANIVADMLTHDGFIVRTENTTEAFNPATLHEVSLIVPIFTTGKLSKGEEWSLTEAVKNGAGIAGFHGGMGDAFRESAEYQFMCGGQFVAHPGDIRDYRVNVIKKDDPIMQGIEDFDYHSEQYYMHFDPSIEVLATTTFTDLDVVMPVVWKRRYGKGRVFYSSLGHKAQEFDVPEMRTILWRGMKWAAR